MPMPPVPTPDPAYRATMAVGLEHIYGGGRARLRNRKIAETGVMASGFLRRAVQHLLER